ncbi:uncharacterized protein Z519_01478 [Cladophialophora bantiana CBS 173.52]|uniref:Azaphilone pigments biosynthesis cluster protein L N-terminal domain-containing protein n=1 Tax=Cladophialophora bantiana (strain ATCC 10958 / CBS 173.52 / CDC B-1940 / NIH 8579) TaxID=1442370 RepID=A0A0D2IMB0_CLAB1|nr:uncharacterized protein Z519_01478 [Cladophialophora bantiana CBS 173.52]KIW97894.1 hypothetical protein Z519_01478 [Cladophialophora bantiana CBS 173.52]
MPEPLAIATAVVTLVTNAYKLCGGLYRTIDEINQAPKHLLYLSQDLKAFYTVLGTLETYLQEHDLCPNVLHPAALADPNGLLEDCVKVLKALQRIVKKFVKHDRASKSEPQHSTPSGSKLLKRANSEEPDAARRQWEYDLGT